MVLMQVNKTSSKTLIILQPQITEELGRKRLCRIKASR